MADRMIDLTAEEAKRLFDYDAETGVLMWKAGRQRGKVAGWPCKRYLRVEIGRNKERRGFYVHRIAFLIVHGRWPEEIDHIDGDGVNNRLSNLREANRSQNNQNTRSRNGFKGVGYSNQAGKWRARIQVEKRRIFLGWFDTEIEAHEAYKNAAPVYHGEFARVV
jgi:hypothetical protein